MSLHYEDIYDIITLARLKASEEDYTVDEALDWLEKEVVAHETENF